MHIVTKGARKSTRLVYGGDDALKEQATRAHRAHRRQVNQDLNMMVDKINCGAVDVEYIDYNNDPDPTHTVTAYDIA